MRDSFLHMARRDREVHLYLLRHGHDVDDPRAGRDGRKLSEEGRLQAQSAADRLAGAAITAICTSGMRRAQETGEIVSRVLGLAWRSDTRLNEAGSVPFRQSRPPLPPRQRRSPDGSDEWSTAVRGVRQLLEELTLPSEGPEASHLWVCHSGTADAIFEIVTETRGDVELSMAHGSITHWQHRPGARDGTWLLHYHNFPAGECPS